MPRRENEMAGIWHPMLAQKSCRKLVEDVLRRRPELGRSRAGGSPRVGNSAAKLSLKATPHSTCGDSLQHHAPLKWRDPLLKSPLSGKEPAKTKQPGRIVNYIAGPKFRPARCAASWVPPYS